jgi:hypothetical protein
MKIRAHFITMEPATNSFDVPILLVIFNRPETQQRVFDEIRKIRPKRLFVVADGPREGKPGEKERCEAARKIIDQVDWECEVKKNFSDTNMGCGKRPASGITWFFENVEEGIILEDDCIPDQSFFNYVQELLEKYRDNERVMVISGDNFQNGIKRGDGDYYFSRLPHTWGWATWRRVWEKYDFEMKDFPDFVRDNNIENIWKKKEVQKYWQEKFSELYAYHFDIWDYQLTYAIWKNDGICISPNANLISNVGFGPNATHTLTSSRSVAGVPLGRISSPLIHPSAMVIDTVADDLDNSLIHMKHTKIKNLLRRMGLFNYARDIYHKYF